MANKRIKKKQEKRALIERAGKIKGITPKQADKLSYGELSTIIAQDERRQQKAEARRKLEAKKRDFIQENGITGNVRESWFVLHARAEAKAAKKAKAKAKRAEYKDRNKKILEDNGILPGERPKGWQKMGVDRLLSSLPERKVVRLNSGAVWLYIGWGDRAGNRRAEDVFGGASGAWYKGRNTDELRNDIIQTIVSRGVDGSEGHAGDTLIMYGDYDAVKQYMEFEEKLGYQTIFFGNEFTEHALLTYTAVAIDSSPESNREYIPGKINGFLDAAGFSDLKLSVTVSGNKEK